MKEDLILIPEMNTTELKSPVSRSIAIDAFRAVTMILMIFVNDLWTLEGVPDWLEHVSADTDGMGLADVVFPAFLFIVGLSVPYAIQSRRKKGDTSWQILWHIIQRTIALLVMGFLFVNSETYSQEALLPRSLWVLLIVVGFFLIWLDYPQPASLAARVLRAAGIILLIVMASLYRSDTASGISALTPQWWGILGKIGWAYFTVSCIYLATRGHFSLQVAALVFLIFFSAASHLGWLDPLSSIRRYVWLTGNGAPAALSMAGIVASLVYRKYTAGGKSFYIILCFLAVVLMIFGFATRPVWEISKIRATPSWVSICAAISILGFMLMAFLTDVKRFTKWYDYIKPAGVSTLTCYLLPYIYYSLVNLSHAGQLPVFLRTGAVGLVKSLVFALLIVALVGAIGKRHIRLKL